MSGFGKIVIATDKFKGSMTAVQASEAVRDGITEGCKEAGRTMPPWRTEGKAAWE